MGNHSSSKRTKKKQHQYVFFTPQLTRFVAGEAAKYVVVLPTQDNTFVVAMCERKEAWMETDGGYCNESVTDLYTYNCADDDTRRWFEWIAATDDATSQTRRRMYRTIPGCNKSTHAYVTWYRCKRPSQTQVAGLIKLGEFAF